MKIQEYYLTENEKPLDRIVSDGGFCGIFRKICCIGDSLASGEFETVDENGEKGYYDLYEYSWGQYLARMTGSKVYNFSRGGMTAREYMESFADANGFWSKDKAAQAYIVALGVNDLMWCAQEIGTIKDIDRNDWRMNKGTFAGWYGQILQRIRDISPDSVLFLMTMPKETSDCQEWKERKAIHAELLWKMSELFRDTYVLDFYRYAPVYDQKFKENFYFNGHMNASGYLLTAKMTASYIDWIIRGNPAKFAATGLIGTGISPGVLIQ
ncbi:MAG: SGNH/GDSL hydrolase family protein [Fusicatenibacter sp.]